MKRWKWAALLLALCLCACTGKEPALPPPENPAPDESAVRPPEGETQALWYWKDLWDSPETRRLELDYAQSFSVDFSAGGYARIRIDQETYLLCPEESSLPRKATPLPCTRPDPEISGRGSTSPGAARERGTSGTLPARTTCAIFSGIPPAEQEAACRGPDESRHSHLPMPTARAPEPQADLVLRNTCGLL